MSALERIRAVLAQEGELFSGLLSADATSAEPGPGELAADGPRTAAHPEEYAFLVEAIYEGYLLHYGQPRLLDVPDPNLALLAGDRLYALGLERLVVLGDLEAVRELADVIALCALLSARGDGALCEPLWCAGAAAVAHGSTDEHERVKELLRSGSAAGADALAALIPHRALAHDIVRPRPAR